MPFYWILLYSASLKDSKEVVFVRLRVNSLIFFASSRDRNARALMPRGRSAKASPDVVRGYEVSFAGELWRVEFVPSGGAKE